MPLRVKATAVLLDLDGLSMNRAVKLLGVPTPRSPSRKGRHGR